MAAVLAVCCVCCGPYRLLCGGGVPYGGKHIIIEMAIHISEIREVYLQDSAVQICRCGVTSVRSLNKQLNLNLNRLVNTSCLQFV